MDNYTYYFSLGYNCYPKMFIRRKYPKNANQTQFFDFAGTSVFSIRKVFENDFKDFFNKYDYKKLPVSTDNKPDYIIQMKYYITFPHDLQNMDQFDDFKEKYERRAKRIQKIFNEKEISILFFRYEQNMNNRIIYDEHKKEYEKSEYEQLLELCNLFKEKYNFKFDIVYMRATEIEPTYKDNIYQIPLIEKLKKKEARKNMIMKTWLINLPKFQLKIKSKKKYLLSVYDNKKEIHKLLNILYDIKECKISRYFDKENKDVYILQCTVKTLQNNNGATHRLLLSMLKYIYPNSIM